MLILISMHTLILKISKARTNINAYTNTYNETHEDLSIEIFIYIYIYIYRSWGRKSSTSGHGHTLKLEDFYQRWGHKRSASGLCNFAFLSCDLTFR